MPDKNNVFKLTGKVQHYQWGGNTFLPGLLHLSDTGGKPFAEYWLGAHDNFPSEIEGVPVKQLNEYIRQQPSVLGERVQQQFNGLPYLFKVLDVKDMLSIQVHPSKQAAGAAFEQEEQAGIPVTAGHRNYKDTNHKPELMVALSEFWLLHGFRHAEAIKDSIAAIPAFGFMAPLFREGRYEDLYRTLMEMDQQKVNETLQPLLDQIIPLYEKNALPKDNPDFWAARAALTFNEPGKIDRGIFSIYLLNLVNLQKEEAVFQDAGVLHAYLEGQNMEIMANSDNVLRGGLTPKHIDVMELMKHISFTPITPHIIYGTRINEFEEQYISPAPDFQLSRLVIGEGKTAPVTAATTEIFIVMEGQVDCTEQNSMDIPVKTGEALVAFAGADIHLRASAAATIYRASVPLHGSE